MNQILDFIDELDLLMSQVKSINDCLAGSVGNVTDESLKELVYIQREKLDRMFEIGGSASTAINNKIRMISDIRQIEAPSRL